MRLSTTPPIYPTLLDRLWPAFFHPPLARHDVAIVLAGSLLLAVSAKLQIAMALGSGSAR
jgi:hypothetical protein